MPWRSKASGVYRGPLADECSSAGVFRVLGFWAEIGVQLAMLENLSDRLGGVFARLKGRGALREEDVREAMREERIARLDAAVALPLARRFIDAVTEREAVTDVVRSVSPGPQRATTC